MPYQIQVAPQIVRITFSGNVTDEKFMDLHKEMLRMESEFSTIPDRLTDVSEVIA